MLRRGMANEPRARPTAEQLRDVLADLHLRAGRPERATPLAPGGLDETPTVVTQGPRRARRKWPFGA